MRLSCLDFTKGHSVPPQSIIVPSYLLLGTFDRFALAKRVYNNLSINGALFGHKFENWLKILYSHILLFTSPFLTECTLQS